MGFFELPLSFSWSFGYLNRPSLGHMSPSKILMGHLAFIDWYYDLSRGSQTINHIGLLRPRLTIGWTN